MPWLRISTTNLSLEDFITIAKTKTVNFSRGFIVKNDLKPQRDKYTSFLYDPQKYELALHITTSRSKESFKITYGKNNWGAKISCNRMFSSFLIDQNANQGRYKYNIFEDSKEGKLYVISLKQKNHGN